MAGVTDNRRRRSRNRRRPGGPLLGNRAVSELKLLVSLNLLATLALAALLWAGQTPWVANVTSLLFGFAAAGGIMQTGLTVFMKLYPARHGMVTGAFYFFGSLASFTVPLITGVLSKTSITAAFGGDLIIGLIGSGLMIGLALTHHQQEEK